MPSATCASSPTSWAARSTSTKPAPGAGPPPGAGGLLAHPAQPARVAEVNALLVDVARDAAAAAIFLIDAPA
jgi:hypothetical protein